MAIRPIAAFLLGLSLAATSFAIDPGKAEGTLTINRKPVKVKYAFAKKEKDYDGKEQWLVLITDKPVSRSLLGEDMALGDAIRAGQIVAAVLTFDHTKALHRAEIKSKALQHNAIPFNDSDLDALGMTINATTIEGTVKSKADQEFFSDVGSFNVKFNANVGTEDRYGDSPASAAELAAGKPKIADGGATGSLKLDGQTIKLTNSIARTKPGTFDEKKTDIVVLLTNTAATNDMLLSDSKLSEAVQTGKLRGIKLTLDASTEKPIHMAVLDPKVPIQMSGTGIWNFDAWDFSTKHVTARFFTKGQEDFGGGEHKYSYDVNFAVPVQAILAPDEMTVDATNGTKLPANGGDPGKAYMAFDKAARAGNLNEMKKYASDTRGMPEGLSQEEIKQMVEMMKAMRPAKVKVNGGFVAGDHATLSVEAQDPQSKAKMNGKIEMVKESNGWKLMAEKWRQ